MSREVYMETENSKGQLVPGMGSTRELAAGLDSQQFLTFTLGSEMYALGILNIKEIIEYGQLTEVPMMPSTVRGVINLRGSVVPVIDLAIRFGSPATQIQRRTCIIIVEAEQDEQKLDIGILVDGVTAVQDILPADIEPPPTFGAKIRADFIAGMGKVDSKFIIILNSSKVLSVDEMATLTDIGQAAG